MAEGSAGAQPPTKIYDLTSMKRFARFSSQEIRLRIVLLGLLAVLMTVWQGGWMYGVLFAAYVLVNVLAIVLLARAPIRVTRTRYAISSLIVSLPLFAISGTSIMIWAGDDPLMHVLGFALTAANMFNMLTVRSVEPIVINWDVLAIVLALAAMIWVDILRFGLGARIWVLSAVFLTMMVYFLNCAEGIARFRKALDKSRISEFERNKIEAVGRLTGGVAHDFNNLLTVIMGNIELAQLSKMPGETGKHLDEAYMAGQRAARLTTQLLGFARQSVLEPHKVHVADIIQSAESMMARLLPASVRIDLWHVSDSVPPVTLDPTKFEAVLVNLFINARDAMPDGGRIHVKTEVSKLRDEPDLVAGSYVLISVRDEGTGISPEDLPKVLEPFFTTKPVGEGSGLGLPMAKGFAEQSGGTLRLFSTLGEGTEVCLLLPVARP